MLLGIITVTPETSHKSSTYKKKFQQKGRADRVKNKAMKIEKKLLILETISAEFGIQKLTTVFRHEMHRSSCLSRKNI